MIYLWHNTTQLYSFTCNELCVIDSGSHKIYIKSYIYRYSALSVHDVYIHDRGFSVPLACER